MNGDKRLIEDLIPIQAINYVAQKEKIGHAATHPRKLHLWWARRPLAAARAAVYATLVRSEDTPEEARSAEYFSALCAWGASDQAIADARRRVLEANAGVPPKVLDMFAGGGAIPLEAARLGCEAIAVELNPVAHLIQRAMLEYPPRFGPSLADDVREWGERWVAGAWARVGHLYPPLGEPDDPAGTLFDGAGAGGGATERAAGRPIAYLWTRTVPCPNPAIGAHEAPLVRQTWLAKKKGRFAALRPRVDRDALTIDWEVVEADDAGCLGFDPAGFSTRGSTTCLLCGAQIDAKYVKSEGVAGRMGITPLAAVTVKASGRGRDYHAVGDYPLPSESDCEAVLGGLEVGPPEEPVCSFMDAGFRVTPYGLTRFRDLFTPRQLATLCAFAQGVHEQHAAMVADGMEGERARAVALYLGLALDRTVDRNAVLCRWDTKNESITNVYARQALPMVWDFAEAAPFGTGAGNAFEYVANIADIVGAVRERTPANPRRANATDLPLEDATIDAVITDPPYYDNISYADLSDFFYVWLKRSVGCLFPDDLGSDLTPKLRELTSFDQRHGDGAGGRAFYETGMARAFAEAYRVLKPGAPLVVVYAHKTTLGWSTLVDALRRACFRITEAWPLDTEMPERSRGQNSSALATSIFLVARKRAADETGDLVEVRRDLEAIIAARLTRLSAAGVNGADLVIATMGAALEPYTRYARVELPNGEELPAEAFLEEVQRRVLAAVLKQVHGLGDGVDAVDAATRYYVLARYSYGYAAIDFDEANNLARSAGLELAGLGASRVPLATIKKGAVTLHDFDERGDDDELGIAGADAAQPNLVDVVHGLLWRAAYQPRGIRAYLDAARPDPAALRLVAQALQGRALRGDDDSAGKHREQQQCERLLGAWNTLVEDNLLAL